MTLSLVDRVKETSTTTGTGPYTLDGAAAGGFQSFAAVGNGNTTYYTATDGTNWEVGVGTYGALESAPALSLDFTSTTTLDSRIALTRATSATYFDSNGTLQTASSGVARFQHWRENGVWVNKGLLVEPARTNIAQFSQRFDDAYWTKSQTTATANVIVAPDGTTTADRINETAVNAGHNVSKTFTGLSINTVYSWSGFLKGGLGRNYILIQFSAVNNFVAATIDITNGSIVSASSGATDTLDSVFFQDCGDGWYRVGISGSLSNFNATNPSFRFQTLDDSLQSSFLGNVNNGFYIWGAQLETGNGTSSYIHTPTSANVTRNADVFSMTSTNFSDWYNQTEGTISAQTFSFVGTSQRTLSINATSSASAEQTTFVYTNSADGGPYFQVIDGSVTQTVLGLEDRLPILYSPSTYTLVGAYKQNDFAASVNGSACEIDNSGTLPTPDRMLIGSDGSNYMNGVVSKIYYWNTRLTNGEVQYLSSSFGSPSISRRLNRDTVLASSNSNNAVNWSAGTKEVFVTFPAEATQGTVPTADDSSIGTDLVAWENFKKTLDAGVVEGVPYANNGTNGVVSTYSLVYTAASGAYFGGVLAPNGDIHFVPRNAAVGQKVNSQGTVSTYSLVYTLSSDAYRGGVLAPNGDIHFIPNNGVRGQKISASGVVSTYSLVYTAANAYAGGILAPNGDIHFIPTSANRGQKISASGVVSTYSLVYTAANAYQSGVLAPNGDIHFVPYVAAVGQKISASGVVSTYSLAYTTTAGASIGGVLSSTGEIYFIPYNGAVGQKISVTGAVSTFSLIYTVAQAYGSGKLAPNGDIHFIPASAVVGQKISAAGVVSTYSLVYTTTFAYFGGVLTPSGDLHFIPNGAARGQIVHTNSSAFRIETCLSSYLNKL